MDGGLNLPNFAQTEIVVVRHCGYDCCERCGGGGMSNAMAMSSSREKVELGRSIGPFGGGAGVGLSCRRLRWPQGPHGVGRRVGVLASGPSFRAGSHAAKGECVQYCAGGAYGGPRVDVGVGPKGGCLVCWM